MVVGAILIVGPLGLDGNTPGDGVWSSEFIAGSPLSCVDVLGESILQRTIQSLRVNGVWPIRIIATQGSLVLSESSGPECALAPHPLDTWFAIEHFWSQFVDQGAEIVMVIRLGAYIEFALGSLVRFLRETGQRAIRLADRQGLLDARMFDALQPLETEKLTLRETVELRMPTYRLRKPDTWGFSNRD